MSPIDTTSNATWLDELQKQLYVDVDALDSDFVKAMAGKIKFHDMTSNQLWVDDELAKPENGDLLKEVASELKEEGWLAIYTRVSVLLCKRSIDYISGRVLLQTLPSQAYSTEATLAHARLYDREFRRVNIHRTRYCIKIPSTGAGLNAANVLHQEGIQTLGTALFSVPQALACSQAKTLYISPYYGEEGKNVGLENLAVQHPNSPRMIQILEAYKNLFKKTGEEQPLVKIASLWTVEEVIAASQLGCHSITVFPGLLEQLSKLPGSSLFNELGVRFSPVTGVKQLAQIYRDSRDLDDRFLPLLSVDPLSKAGTPVDLDEATQMDYLGNNGSLLDETIAADPEVAKRLQASLDWFIGRELQSKKRIEDALEAIRT